MRRTRKRPTRAGKVVGAVFLLAAGFVGGRVTAPTRAPGPERTSRNVCRVIRIVDGDTLRVWYQDEDQPVRLLRVDTPERGERGYREATEALTELIQGGEVRLEFESQKRDSFGRLLCYVFVHELNVNVEMVRRGWSEFYTKHGEGKFAGAFTEAEQEAREAG